MVFRAPEGVADAWEAIQGFSTDEEFPPLGSRQQVAADLNAALHRRGVPVDYTDEATGLQLPFEVEDVRFAGGEVVRSIWITRATEDLISAIFEVGAADDWRVHAAGEGKPLTPEGR